VSDGCTVTQHFAARTHQLNDLLAQAQIGHKVAVVANGQSVRRHLLPARTQGRSRRSHALVPRTVAAVGVCVRLRAPRPAWPAAPGWRCSQRGRRPAGAGCCGAASAYGPAATRPYAPAPCRCPKARLGQWAPLVRPPAPAGFRSRIEDGRQAHRVHEHVCPLAA